MPIRVRLICRTADRGTAELAEQAELTEPKEMTVLLQLPLASLIKLLVTINYNINRVFTVPFSPQDRRDRALTFSGSHFVIGFNCTERAGLGVPKPSPAL